MKKTALIFLFASLSTCLLIFSAGSRSSFVWADDITPMKAAVVKVSGSVRILNQGGISWHDAKVNEVIGTGSQIETKENGQIEIKLDNNNVINLKPNTKLILQKLTANLKTGDYENLLESNIGKIRAKVDKMKGASRFEIKTPTAVACVRGTIMYLIAYPDSTITFFEEGTGFVTNPFSGQTFDVAPGNVYQVDQNGNVSGPVAPTPEQLQDIIEGWSGGSGAEGYSGTEGEEGGEGGDEGGDDLGDDTGSNDNSGDAADDKKNFQNQDPTLGQGTPSGGTDTPIDTDGDGTPDSTDTDDDNDRMTDVYENDNGLDLLVNDAGLDKDIDGLTNLEEFELGTYANNDDSDNDDYSDKDESDNNTDALSGENTPPDNDLDYVSDLNDPDDDNDEYTDANDAFPFDSSEWIDTDSDGTGNNADTDDDNDRLPDTLETKWKDPNLNTDPLAADTDGDGVNDVRDAFPNDPELVGSRDDIRRKEKNLINFARLRDNREEYLQDAERADLLEDINAIIEDNENRRIDGVLEQIADAQTGKVLTDRLGNRVRVEQYVLRPGSDTVEVININLRTEGDHAGISTLDWTTRFGGQNLDSLSGGQLRALPWNDYLETPVSGNDLVGYGPSYTDKPSHYPTFMSVELKNPSANSFYEERALASLRQAESGWTQRITRDQIRVNGGELEDFTVIKSFGSGIGNPNGFKYVPDGGTEPDEIKFNFYVIGDGADTGLIGGMGSKNFNNMWEALAVNMNGVPSRMNIGNNNLEIRISGSSYPEDIDAIYVPFTRLEWNTAHDWLPSED